MICSETGCSTWNARVHLHEVEAAVRVEQELDRAGIDVSHAAYRLEGSLAHRLARLLVDDGTRSLFDELLVPALNRAVALAEVHGVAMRIGNDLNLHVTRTADEFLEVDLVVAEGVGRLGARGDEHLLELLVVVCLAHAPYHRHQPMP